MAHCLYLDCGEEFDPIENSAGYCSYECADADADDWDYAYATGRGRVTIQDVATAMEKLGDAADDAARAAENPGATADRAFPIQADRCFSQED